MEATADPYEHFKHNVSVVEEDMFCSDCEVRIEL